MSDYLPTHNGARFSNAQYKNFFRLFCIHNEVSQLVLYWVFLLGSSDRYRDQDGHHTEKIGDYYERKGITGFKKSLYKEQKQKIEEDLEGTSFDITLISVCLRNGSHGLAPKNDQVWKDDDRASIESLISTIKNKRNAVFIELENGIDKEKLLSEAEDIRKILNEIIDFLAKKYNLPTDMVDAKKKEVNDTINKYLNEDFEPKTLEEYKEQILFEHLVEVAIRDGKRELISYYKRNSDDKLSGTNHIIEIRFDVGNVLTDMMLNEGSTSDQGKKTSYEMILKEDGTGKRTEKAIIINGVAGSGKTTITKGMLSEWERETQRVEHLEEFVFIFKHECRNTAVKTFDEMIHHFMPNTAKSYKSGDFKKVILSQPILIVLDGIDELNTSSDMLLDEIINLKKSSESCLMLTTRPEKMDYLTGKLRSHQIDFKHIQLLGVPQRK